MSLSILYLWIFILFFPCFWLWESSDNLFIVSCISDLYSLITFFRLFHLVFSSSLFFMNFSAEDVLSVKSRWCYNRLKYISSPNKSQIHRTTVLSKGAYGSMDDLNELNIKEDNDWNRLSIFSNPPSLLAISLRVEFSRRSFLFLDARVFNCVFTS